MKNISIRLLVILGSASLIGIILTQVYWVTEAVGDREAQFNHSVQMALRRVVESLCEINGNDIPSNDPIDQISGNYFIARTNYMIDLSSLDYLIQAEFQKRGMAVDFEYGVYDCQTQSMVYGDFITMNEDAPQKPAGQLPVLKNDEYYFGVYFPSKTRWIVSEMGFWKFTTGLMLLIVILFGYALFVILRQKRLSEIQRDFINNVTHEFKTPLATLIVSSEVMQNEASNERQKKYARIIGSETRRLQQHVSQLLETAALDEKEAADDFSSIDILKTFHGIQQHFTNVKIEWVLPSDESCVIRGDQHLFQGLVYNLLDNAAKYGKGYIRVSLTRARSSILLEIADNGPGIPAAEQKLVFKKFYRIFQQDRHDVRGFGLGLYFVKKAMSQLRGKLRLRSDSSGTCFHLTFPAYE